MGLQRSPGATPTTRTNAAATRDCRATAGRSGRRATPAASLACEAFGASVVVRRVDSMRAASLVADSVASPCRTTAAGMEGGRLFSGVEMGSPGVKRKARQRRARKTGGGWRGPRFPKAATDGKARAIAALGARCGATGAGRPLHRTGPRLLQVAALGCHAALRVPRRAYTPRAMRPRRPRCSVPCALLHPPGAVSPRPDAGPGPRPLRPAAPHGGPPNARRSASERPRSRLWGAAACRPSGGRRISASGDCCEGISSAGTMVRVRQCLLLFSYSFGKGADNSGQFRGTSTTR